MARSEETFTLVEKDVPAYQAGDIAEMADGKRPAPEFHIKRIIRTFLSRDRANEDLALLQDINPLGTYDVLPVEYIDN